MGFQLTSKQYCEYLQNAAKRIADNKDYITELDAATGDGDHWANLHMGFEAILAQLDELAASSISDLFKKLGMTMMSKVGGSSGVLYGSAYIAAAKATVGKEALDAPALGDALSAMAEAMMSRGKSEPGFKTMIDALYPAAQACREGIEKGLSDVALISAMKEAAMAGAQSTKDMEAVRGRACYQADKGVGHLDPGAITMAYQLEELADYILASL